MVMADGWQNAEALNTDCHKDIKILHCSANGGFEVNQHAVLQYVYAKDDGGGLDQIRFDYLSLNISS